MKKLIFTLLVMFLGQHLFSQIVGELAWQRKAGFEEGITQAIFTEGSTAINANHSQVLIAVNSNAGTINIYSVDKETGAIGELKSSKTFDKRGTWAVSLLGGNSVNKYVMISFADYGVIEIYPMDVYGRLGDKTWETNSFEKGISIVVAMQDNVLLVKPNAGFAWIFTHKDGKLGQMTWQTQGWDKGMAAGTSAGSNTAALTHPDGKFWMVNCSTGEAVIEYSTDKFAKGITIMASNPVMQSGIFVGDPYTGHQWELQRKAANLEVVKDSPNWEKGLTVQAFAVFSPEGYVRQDKGFFYVFKPEIGTVWAFRAKVN